MSTRIAAAECPVTGTAASYLAGVVDIRIVLVARPLVATAALTDRAVDMSRTEQLAGRAADAEVGREARLLHVKHIVALCMLPR